MIFHMQIDGLTSVSQQTFQLLVVLYTASHFDSLPLTQLRFELGGVVVFAPVGDFAIFAGDEDAGGEAGRVAGEAVAAGKLPLAGGRIPLRDERAQRKADLGEGAEERRERLAYGGYAAERLTGGAGEDRIRREVLQNGVNVRNVPGDGLVLQDRGGCARVGRHK